MEPSSFPISKAWHLKLLAAVAAAGLVLGSVDGALALDYGSWNMVTGTGTYLNGDTITINLGPNAGLYSNADSTNAIGVPFDQPGAGQYAHLANNVPLSSWTATFDLSNYQVSPQTVFAFANLGANAASIQTANIEFLDGSSNPLSLTGATFVGSFAHQWTGLTFDESASFNLNTGTWSYAANNGQNYEGASAMFFLTNIPSNAVSMEFTVNNPSNSSAYLFDSIFFAVGSPLNAVPEPSTLLIFGVGLGCIAAVTTLRRKSSHQRRPRG